MTDIQFLEEICDQLGPTENICIGFIIHHRLDSEFLSVFVFGPQENI